MAKAVVPAVRLPVVHSVEVEIHSKQGDECCIQIQFHKDLLS